MIDTPSGAEESRAKQLEAQKARLSQCIETGEVGFVSTIIYPFPPSKVHVGAASTLEKADREYISEKVLGVFHDGRTEQLVVDCSGKDGFKTPRLVADEVADILGGKEPNGNGSKWRGSYIVSLCPAPQLPEPEENKTRIIGEEVLHAKKLELLRSDPTRVIPLPFLGTSK